MKRRVLRTSLLLVTACAAAFASTLVVPNAQATAPGNAPIVIGSNAVRVQEVVGGGQFTTPITIVGARLRAAPGTGRLNSTTSSFKLTLSTTQASANTGNGRTLPSATYASNVGPDATVVYNGAITISSPGCALPGPCPFDMAVSFATPFSYDPSKGRLLIDYVTSASPPATTVGSLDGVAFPDSTSSTIANVAGDPTQPAGSVGVGGIVFGLDVGGATVTFNDYPNATSNPQLNFVSSGGLAFTDARGNSGGMFIVGNPAGPPFSGFGVTTVSNGTVFLAGGGGGEGTNRQNGGIIVTSPGTTFSLSAIDLDRALTQSDAALAVLGIPPNASTINVVGTLLGGGTVVATFTLNGSTTFQTFTFPSTWQNLIAVTFTGNNDGTTGASATATALFAMDNIVYTPGAAFTCNYSLSAGSAAVSSFGDRGSITVTTSPGCVWNVSNLPPWLAPINDGNGGGSVGVGSGTAGFFVQSNSGAARSATITVAGISFPVEQGSGLVSTSFNNFGTFAQVTSEGTWKFTLNTINLATSSLLERFSFNDNNGSPLPMPWTFPQTPAATSGGPLVGSTLDRSLAPNAQFVMESTGPDNIAALVGWGQLSANARIGAFGTFSNPTFGWNAVVPLETRNTAAYYLAFDNTGPITTGAAVAYPGGPQGANINVIIRDDTGTQIGGGTINLPANGHDSFMLNAKYPITAGKRGMIEFDRPAGANSISVLGLRANQFSATASALTTLPILAGIPSGGGGSITHATYNGGFTSVFYVVNTGTTSGTFTLSFADENTGAPIQFPLSLPQTGTTTTTSSLSRTLAPGAMLVAETQAQDALAPVVASAQLTTTGGNISAFEVFRWTTFSQEASVPLENRTPPSFVLVFDNTNGQSTGVAVSNRLSAAAADIPVTIRDDAGTLLLTTSIHLSAQGHASFMLPDRYAAAAGKRGMVEFTVPAGGSISVVGLRAKADGTLTTIPVLTK